jgi:uncharacterized protein DUF6283
MNHAPCPSCPWRRISTPGGSDIPNFDMDMMRNLVCTVGDGDAFRPIMACHYSGEGAETGCRGYLAVEGWTNLAVRMQVLRGRLDMAAIDKACAEIDLYDSFGEMLDASERAVKP